MSYDSWGRNYQSTHLIHSIFWKNNIIYPSGPETLLPYGMGRSYGDVCQNPEEWLLPTRGLNRFIHFDREQGVLACEAGVSFDEILSLIVPKGYFLPVTPGTKFVTVGGAIANDIHGKNHHQKGTFGCYVTQFELLRSDGQLLLCSPDENAHLFKATIGGLGLTGLITWAEFKLQKIKGPLIDCETIPFRGLHSFFNLSEESKDYEYTVAWIDSLSLDLHGVFFRGNHAQEKQSLQISKKNLAIPFNFPSWVLNKHLVRCFNTSYSWIHSRRKKHLVSYEPFFYPLDRILNWNKIYGKKGFFQYQCLIPKKDAFNILSEILKLIAKSGLASFLSVLKEFGNISSPGLMSFPREGTTLAMDFSNYDQKTLDLFNELDQIVSSVHGRVYPAKDAHMSSVSFQNFFPEWKEFINFVDPRFSSGFWRRVTGGGL